MSGLRVVGGTCGHGAATYDLGVFAMPDGGSRGVETVASLSIEGDPPVWTGQIVRGLRGALRANDGLPKPLGFAASALGAGLGLFDRPARFTATFADGSTATIEADAALAACIERDREVVRGVLARGIAATAPPKDEAAGGGEAPTAIFEYEKRNGRLRRVAKVPPKS